jgi:Phenol hydroxylase, C-terminal dimerisation domain
VRWSDRIPLACYINGTCSRGGFALCVVRTPVLTHSASGIGVCYRSRLTDDGGTRCASHLKPGERLPPSPLVRLGDWQPMDLQDLAPSDGLFKLFVLPCDIRVPDHKARLKQFAAMLSESAGPHEMEHVSLFVIVNNSKEDVLWKDVPLLFRSWKRCVVCVVQ